MEVEHLTAVLDATGLTSFIANMAAADQSTDTVKRALGALAAISEVAAGALEQVRVSTGQAGETAAAVTSINRSVSSVTDTALRAANHMEQVKLGSAQAATTASAAAAEIAALKRIELQADDTRRSLEGMTAVGAMGGGGIAGGGAVAAATAALSAARLRQDLGGGGVGTAVLLSRAGDEAQLAGLLRGLGFAAAGGSAGGAAGGGGGSGGGGLLAALGWGGGMFGMAKFGSLLSLAGFGAEHAVTSAIGVGGSMVGGLVGGGLLGLGALGTMGVGMGTDLAGIGQAAGDTKKVSTDLDALNTAIAEYGRTSKQAAKAQLQLNTDLAGFSPVARNAVLAAAQTSQQFKDLFDQATGQAEKTGAEILNQAMKTGEAFLPTIGTYAAQNMGIIQQGLQPFFAWLKNPGGQGGLGIFTNLEQIFQKNLPNGIHAMEQGFELFTKTIDVAAQHTGGLTKILSDFFTKWNSSAKFPEWAAEVNKLIGLFDAWAHLFGSLVGTIAAVFRPALGFGEQFAITLTGIIDKIKTWLDLTSTQGALQGLFSAHLQEVIAGIGGVITAALPVAEQLATAFMKISAAASNLAANALKQLVDLINQVMRIPFASQIAGWTLGLLVAKSAVTGLLTLFGVMPRTLTGVEAQLAAVNGQLEQMNATMAIVPAAAAAAEEGVAAAATGMDAVIATTTAMWDTLKASLLSMNGAVILITIALSVIPKSAAGQSILNQAGIGWAGHIPILGGLATQAARVGNAIRGAFGETPYTPETGPPSAPPGYDPNTYGQAPSSPSNPGGYLPYGTPTRTPSSAATSPTLVGGHTAAYWKAYQQHMMAAYGTPGALPAGIPAVTGAGGAGGAGGGGGAGAAVKPGTLPGALQLQLALAQAQPNNIALNQTALKAAIQNEQQQFAKASTSLAKAQIQQQINTYTQQMKQLQPAPGTISPALQLALAQAQATPQTGDDKTALRKIITNLTSQLHKATSTAAKATIQGDINQYVQQLQQLTLITGAALLPAGLKSKLTELQAQGQADADYNAVLVGAAAENYATMIWKNLNAQATVLTQEVADLKRKLDAASGAQKTAIQQELATVTGDLQTVQQQILQSLQGSVQALQSRVGTLFSNVQQQFDTAFEAQTQQMVDALGQKFFQNGLQTPLEAQLTAMQAQDQLGSLQDSIQQATDQLNQDQNTLGAVVYDATTGITSFIYNAAAAQQIATDQKALAAAQRQLDEYNLSIKASQERATADQNYADQVKALQATRTAAETEMNAKLAALSDQFQNGTGSMQALSMIAADYGIQISSTTIPDFTNLSTASQALVQALADLAAYITKITGETLAPPAPTGPAPGTVPTGGDTGGTGPGPGASDQALLAYAQAAQAAAEAAGYTGKYTKSGGAVYYQSDTGTYGKKPMLAAGGIVTGRTEAIIGEAGPEAVIPLSRLATSTRTPMTVQLTVQTLDPQSVNWDRVAKNVRDAFVRMAKSGATNPWA